MEGAETLLLSPASVLYLNIISDNFIDSCTIADVLDILISNATAHVATLTLLTGIATEMGMESVGTGIGQAGNLVNDNAKAL